jgi:hypothetical protein
LFLLNRCYLKEFISTNQNYYRIKNLFASLLKLLFITKQLTRQLNQQKFSINAVLKLCF